MITTLAASALCLLLQSSFPTNTTPIRNTFAVAAETVIDNASAVDVKTDDTRFNAEMQELKVSKDTLSSMAADPREKDIVDSANHLVFLLSACHIQSKDGAPTEKCEAQFNHARTRIMEALGKHKSGAAWLDGPPA